MYQITAIFPYMNPLYAYRRISGRKNWNGYLLRYGRCVVYQEWWHQQPDGDARLQARLQHVAPASWQQVRQETRHCH